MLLDFGGGKAENELFTLFSKKFCLNKALPQ